MTPDQREQAVATGAKIAPFFSYATVVFIPVGYLIVAGVLLGMTAMMSAGLKYKQVYAIVCYARLPSVIFSVLGIIVMFLKNPADFNIQNPLAFNVGSVSRSQRLEKVVHAGHIARPVLVLDDLPHGDRVEGRRREATLLQRRADRRTRAMGDLRRAQSLTGLRSRAAGDDPGSGPPAARFG